MILKITSPEGVDYRQVVFFFISEDRLSVQFVAANGQITTLQGMEVTNQATAHSFDMYTDEMHILDSVNIQLPPEVVEVPPTPEVIAEAFPKPELPVEDMVPEGEETPVPAEDFKFKAPVSPVADAKPENG